MKNIAAAEFQAKCLRIIGRMTEDCEPVTITDRGRAVAMLSPMPAPSETPSIIGAMKGSVLAYDDPFRPAADLSDWDPLR